MVFLIQFGVDLHLWVFQKAEIALLKATCAISAFWGAHSCGLIPNWTRNCMITYTTTTTNDNDNDNDNNNGNDIK